MDDLLAQDFVERGGAGSGASSFNKRVHVPLYQHEYDALVNQMFNGTNGKPAVLVNRGRYTAAGQAFLQYKAADTTRRAMQNKMFMKGEYE